MIPRSKPIARRSRPRPYRKGQRAATKRKCKALWSKLVREKNGGRCWVGDRLVTGRFSLRQFCAGPIDPAHCFPKGSCPAAQFDIALGFPVCRAHHDSLGNGDIWNSLLVDAWGLDLYLQRYRRAHTPSRQVDYSAVLAELESA